MILKIFLCSMCILVSSISFFTDFKTEKIKNILIYPFLISSSVLNIIYSYQSCFLKEFLINFLLISILAVVLYIFNFWGAGDSKFLIFVISSIPPDFYLDRIISVFPSVLILMYIFIICYIFILMECGYTIIKNKVKYKQRSKIDVKHFFKSYLRGFIIITFLNQMFHFIFKYQYAYFIYIIMFFNFFASIKLINFKLLRSKWVIVSLAVVDIIICLFSNYKLYFMNTDITMVVGLFLFIIARKYLERFTYQIINVDNLNAGMILSLNTTIHMKKSKVKGLPELSTEDLRSKLSESEVESIKRWKNSKYGSSSVTIVKMLPFGAFISIGSIIFIIESTLRLCF